MKRNLLIIMVLVVVTVVTFAGVRHLGFVGYDDPDYVTNNHEVQKGLTGAGLAWAFGQMHGFQTYWHPVTWISHMLDCQLFGVNPAGHHLMSLAFHTANVVLLFVLLQSLTRQAWPSAILAALFAAHPIQVESVAWVTERKNLVSTFFALITLLAYIRFTRGRKWAWFAACVASFMLALMSKPAIVTLPLVMLLLDFWPLGRLQIFDSAGNLSSAMEKKSFPVFSEKIPFLILSVIISAVTVRAHQALGMFDEGTTPPFALKYGNIIVSYFTYLRKLVWPVDLAVFYPFPRTIPVLEVFSALAVLVMITVAIFSRIRQKPFLTVGWLWFLGALVPMIGIVYVGIQAMADRFMYVPIIGVLILVCFGMSEWVKKSRTRAKVAGALSVAVIFACVALSRAQVQTWQSDFALFDHARQVTKDNYMAYTALGGILVREGKPDQAMTNLQTALELQPNYADAHLSLGHLYLYAGKFSEAAKEFEEALKLRIRMAHDAHVNAGVAYEMAGNFAAAGPHYEEALRLDPASGKAYLGLGNMFLMQGRFKEAVEYLRKAVEFEPNSSEAMARLAWLLATHTDKSLRNGPEAVRLAEKASKLTDFTQPQIVNALAAAYAENGQFQLAATAAEKAIEIARATGQTNLIPTTESLLKIYRSGKAYHEGE